MKLEHCFKQWHMYIKYELSVRESGQNCIHCTYMNTDVE